jgi:hypothetical protein
MKYSINNNTPYISYWSPPESSPTIMCYTRSHDSSRPLLVGSGDLEVFEHWWVKSSISVE